MDIGNKGWSSCVVQFANRRNDETEFSACEKEGEEKETELEQKKFREIVKPRRDRVEFVALGQRTERWKTDLF